MHIQTSSAVRIIPPSLLTGKRWLVENYINKRKFSLTLPGVYLLILCMKPISLDKALTKMARAMNMSHQSVEPFVYQLLDRQLLVTETTEEERAFEKMRGKWEKKGWAEAFEYYLSTYDYKFLGANKEGIEKTREKMIKYSEIEPDHNRSKSYPQALEKIPTPAPHDSLVPIAISDVWKGRIRRNPLDAHTLSNLMSMTFGNTKRVKPYWTGKDLIRKTSPSGGARHPSEAYMAVVDVPGLESGWYHYSSALLEMELLEKDSVDENTLNRLFPTTYARAEFQVAAIIIITSVFERNMYRYREPRTFRTIHMDAGHLCSTFELLSRAYGFRTFAQYGANEQEIEQKLNINGLEEGYMLSISLGM